MDTNDKIIILLADDDEDDCLLFKEALAELSLPSQLIIVRDGDQLMDFLGNKSNPVPHVLFMDLNMPRKNGFECLVEIKNNKKLEQLCIVITTTSCKQEIINHAYLNGAQYYICKPPEFSKLKKVILQVLTYLEEYMVSPTIAQPGGKKSLLKQPSKENFVITGNLTENIL